METQDDSSTPHLRLGHSIKISTWKCGGLSFSLFEQCQMLNHDILALTETHDKGSMQKNTNFIPAERAPENDPYSGVALLLSNRIAKGVVKSNSYGSRIVYARIRAKPCYLFVIATYVPHCKRSNPSTADTLKDLDNLLEKVNPRDCVVLLGDFNCKLARSVQGATGKWNIHKRASAGGQILHSIMERRNLYAVSTMFQPKRNKSNATFLSRDTNYGPSQIDHILVSSRWASSVSDCKVSWGISCQRWGRRYDHGLVCATLTTRVKMGTKTTPIYNYGMMRRNDALKTEFERHVAQNMDETECNVNDASESLSRLRSSMQSAAETVLPVVKPIKLRRRCVSDRTQHLYDERKRKFDSSTAAERKAASTAIMMSSREDYRSYIDGILDDMEAAERKGNMREISRLTKILSGKKSSYVSPSKDLQGDPILSTEQLLSSWNEFMSAKFASPDDDRPKEHIVSEEDYLSDEELEACFKALNRNRKAGWDNIPIEGYDESPTAKQELFRIVRLIWDSELPPPELVRGIFIMLYKKADRNDFANYRAICLLCHAYKLLSAVVAHRMQVPLEAILPDSQAGFRPARGARDNVCILKWTIDMLLRESREAVVTFIDYTAAFDTLSHAFLDEALNHASVSCKLRRIIQAIYTGATGCVRVRQHDGTIIDSKPFNIARGVLQGDIFSSSAFIAGLWRTLTKHDLPDMGVAVGVAPYVVTISKLEYADDIAFVDVDANGASIRITLISRGSTSDASMSISIKKTKAMHVHAKERVTPTTEAEVIALKLKAKCPDCDRPFKNERGMKIHRARWCDGGATIRSRKVSLADKAVQHEKRKALQKQRARVVVDGKELEDVYSFDYLGARTQCDGDDEADVRHRMSIAQAVYSSLWHMWKDHRLPRTMKLRLYRLAVCSTLTHACEAWSFTSRIQQIVNGLNSRCLHSITGEHFRVTATQPAYDLVLAIRRRRLRYLGHILRMDTQRLVRQTLIAYTSGGNNAPEGSLLQDCPGRTIEELTIEAFDRPSWAQKVDLLT